MIFLFNPLYIYLISVRSIIKYYVGPIVVIREDPVLTNTDFLDGALDDVDEFASD